MKEKDLKKRLRNTDYYYDLLLKSGRNCLISKNVNQYRFLPIKRELKNLYALDCEQPKWLVPYLPKLWALIERLEHLYAELPQEFLKVKTEKNLKDASKDIVKFYLVVKD